MKIFPISEVWSQMELSLLLVLAITGAAGGVGRGHRQSRRRRTVVQRAIDVIELIGGNDLGPGGNCRVRRSFRCGLQDSVARADIALAAPAGVSADASCALALATDGGSEG